MTAEAQRQRSNAKARAYRARHKQQEAARARAWREARPGYSTEQARKYRAKNKANLQALIAAADNALGLVSYGPNITLMHQLQAALRPFQRPAQRNGGLCA